MATNILFMPIAQFVTTAPSNADLIEPIFTLKLNGAPLDLTGISFRAMARSAAADPRILLDAQSANWTSADVSSPNGWLVCSASAGTLSWAIPQAQIAALLLQQQSAKVSVLVSDILAHADGCWEIVGQGTFSAVPGITRWSPQV